jgi:hypothetical protein
MYGLSLVRNPIIVVWFAFPNQLCHQYFVILHNMKRPNLTSNTYLHNLFICYNMSIYNTHSFCLYVYKVSIIPFLMLDLLIHMIELSINPLGNLSQQLLTLYSYLYIEIHNDANTFPSQCMLHGFTLQFHPDLVLHVIFPTIRPHSRRQKPLHQW